LDFSWFWFGVPLVCFGTRPCLLILALISSVLDLLPTLTAKLRERERCGGVGSHTGGRQPMGGGGSERFWEVGWFLWLELWVMSWLQMQIVARKPSGGGIKSYS
jgi:hypothetical protein